MFTLHLERGCLELLGLLKAPAYTKIMHISCFLSQTQCNRSKFAMVCVSGAKSRDVVITQLLSTQ